MRFILKLGWMAYLIAGWMLFDWRVGVLITGASFLVRLYYQFDDEIEESELECKSCEGCKNDLGGGHCRINVEGECREGGGFELYEPKDGRNDE